MHPWWRTPSLILGLLAFSLPVASRAVVGPPGAIVHIRWQPSLDLPARQALEARFRLRAGQRLDESTWRYDLRDTSTANIGAIVRHAAVEDTHNVDRTRYTVDRAALRTPRRQRFAAGGDAVVTAADILAALSASLVIVFVGLGRSGRAPAASAVPGVLAQACRHAARRTSTALTPIALWLQRGIPEVDARTAGVFRLVFGALVVLFFFAHTVDVWWLDATFDLKVEGDLHPLVLQWLRERPYIVTGLAPWLLTTGIAFTVGLFTRLTYPLFVAGAIVWAFVAVSLDSTHPHSTLVLAIVALLPSRWGDALSVDDWRRRASGKPRAASRSKRYGYSVWVPGLVFGIAFAAAAWAKLSSSPQWTSWVLSGSVKYHFITDARNAPVDWGLQLVSHPRLAILASLGAVAIETLVVTTAFTRSELYRLSLGIGALSMLVGFRLFMGVIWYGWWILLLGFLPWQSLVARLTGRLKPAPTGETGRLKHVEAGVSRPGLRTATASQLAAIAFVITQQIVISTLHIERAPMFTHYPMYSASYASLEAFNRSTPPVYRILAATDRGLVELPCDPAERVVTEFRAALGGSADAAASIWRQLRGCGDLTGVRHVVFEGAWRRFDGERLAYTMTPDPALRLGPLAAGPRVEPAATP